MFTGLVEEVGRVEWIESRQNGARIRIRCDKAATGLEIGDSVAVNGCCLTAVGISGDGFEAEMVAETLARTNLGSVGEGDPVNLERPMPADGRFGGHVVQGHVDGVAAVEAIHEAGDGVLMSFHLPQGLSRYVVEKGSVTVDGVSLTVAAVAGDTFEVALIPHTLEATTLGVRGEGDQVNIEVDLIAKYVERLLGERAG